MKGSTQNYILAGLCGALVCLAAESAVRHAAAVSITGRAEPSFYDLKRLYRACGVVATNNTTRDVFAYQGIYFHGRVDGGKTNLDWDTGPEIPNQ